MKRRPSWLNFSSRNALYIYADVFFCFAKSTCLLITGVKSRHLKSFWIRKSQTVSKKWPQNEMENEHVEVLDEEDFLDNDAEYFETSIDIGHFQNEHKYLLLTEFEGRTVSYGPSFFPIDFMAQARSARAINRREKTRIRNLQYRPRKRG